MTGRVFVVLPTADIGGAEKRFAGICAFQRGRGRDVRIVAPAALCDKLCALEELQQLSHDAFEPVASPSRLDMLKALTRIRRTNRGSVFHDVLVSPLVAHGVPPRGTVFTIPNSSLSQYNRKGLALVYGGVLAAARVDVLDADVHAALQHRFPWKRRDITLTPGSFVDRESYSPSAEKTNTLVFCGLFSEEKQIHRLIDAIPTIDAALRNRGIRDPAFRLLGRETAGASVADRCAALQPAIDVRAYFESNPARVLSGAKVFFSLQRTTNFPSKALLEALACGCVPIVTDVGATRLLAREDFAFYVERDFRPAQMAEACARALLIDESERARRVRAMRRLVEESFSVEPTAAYYGELWDSALSRSGRARGA